MASFTINGNVFLTTSSKLHEVFDNAYIAYVFSSLQSKLHMHFKVYSQWSFLTTEQLFYVIHCGFFCVFLIAFMLYEMSLSCFIYACTLSEMTK